jgi:hypothetical protein
MFCREIDRAEGLGREPRARPLRGGVGGTPLEGVG